MCGTSEQPKGKVFMFCSKFNNFPSNNKSDNTSKLIVQMSAIGGLIPSEYYSLPISIGKVDQRKPKGKLF